MRKITKILLSMLLVFSSFSNIIAYAANELEGKIIILDAGHGTDYNVYKGYDEGVQMLNLSLKIEDELEKLGATVYQLRDTEENTLLSERSATANKISLEFLRDEKSKQLLNSSGADFFILQSEIAELERLINITDLIISSEDYAKIYLNHPFDTTYTRETHPDLESIFRFEEDPLIGNNVLLISLHTNATAYPIDESRNGLVAFYISISEEFTHEYYDEYVYVEHSKSFGDILATNLLDVGFESKDVLEYNFHIIREVNIPAVLMENGFHTNDVERKMLSNEFILSDMAEIYAESITQYFGGELANSDEVNYAKLYRDVDLAAWYGPYVNHVISNGILSGTSHENFSPDGEVSVNTFISSLEIVNHINIDPEMLLIINSKLDYDTSLTRKDACELIYPYIKPFIVEDDYSLSYSDISDDELNMMASIVSELNIMDSDENFNPDSIISRADASYVLANLNDFLNSEALKLAEELESNK